MKKTKLPTVSERLDINAWDGNSKLIIDGEEWGITRLVFKLEDGRLKAYANAVPPYKNDE